MATKKKLVKKSTQAAAPATRQAIPPVNKRTLQGGVSGGINGAAAGATMGGPYGAAAGAAVGIIGGAMSDAGGQTVSGLTQEDIQKANKINDKNYGEVRGDLNSNVTSGGGSYQNVTARDYKREQYKQYLVDQGMTPQEANQKMNQQLNKKGNLGNVKGFRQAVKSGAIEGVNRGQNGRYNVDDKHLGDFYNDTTDTFIDDQTGLTQEVFDAQEGMPEAFADDTRAGLDYRDQIRDSFASAIGGGGQFDAADVADIKSIMNLQKMNMQNLHGNFQDSGFLSSNLSQRGFEGMASNTMNDAFTKLYGAKADKRSQRAKDLLASASVLGGPSTYGEYSQGSFNNPNSYGGTTGQQNREFIAGRQDTKAGFANANADREANINLTPRF